VEAVRARLQALGTPVRLLHRIATLHALSGAVGIAALSTDLALDEMKVATAYTRLGEALGIDWARGAATSIRSEDQWERLLLAGVIRGFETMRLELLRRIVPRGGDPEAEVAAWLSGHRPDVEELKRVIASARGSPPTLAMVAHLANVGRVALSVD
jgi:glutamate dehydrogenase